MSSWKVISFSPLQINSGADVVIDRRGSRSPEVNRWAGTCRSNLSSSRLWSSADLTERSTHWWWSQSSFLLLLALWQHPPLAVDVVSLTSRAVVPANRSRWEGVVLLINLWTCTVFVNICALCATVDRPSEAFQTAWWYNNWVKEAFAAPPGMTCWTGTSSTDPSSTEGFSILKEPWDECWGGTGRWFLNAATKRSNDPPWHHPGSCHWSRLLIC